MAEKIMLGEEPVVDLVPGPLGEMGPSGADGDSAYQIAVANGFVGTEADWLDSLEGEKGNQGEQGPPSVLTGEIKMVSGDIPEGYLPCSGGVVSRSEFPELFSVVGTRFSSGDGVSTFGLPRFSGLLGVQGDFDLGGLTDLIEGTGGFETPSPSPYSAFNNLATNPSFETAGATVEVRRNYVVNPQTPTSINWGTGGVGVRTVENDSRFTSGRAARFETTTKATSGSYWMGSGVGNVVSASDVWFISIRASVPDGATNIRMDFGGAGATWVSVITTQTVDHGDGTQTFWAVATATSISTGNLSPILRMDAVSIDVGDVTLVGDAMAAKASVFVSYFDGSYSPDPDLTPSWTDAVNGSASVLRAPAVNTITSTRTHAFCVQSDRWAESGSKSLRIMPRTTSNDSAAMVFGSTGGLVGFEAGKTYTVAAYARLEAPQTGPLSSSARSVRFSTNTVAGWTGTTYQRSDAAPNEAGVHLVRFTFTVPADAVWALLEFYSGASLGNGDVWWDDFTIVEGEHPGLMPFNGDHCSVPDTEVQWSGTPHASTSQLLVNTPVYDPDRSTPSLAGPFVYQSAQSWSKSGSRSLLIDGSVQLYSAFPDPYGVLTASESLAHMSGGKSYTVVGWLRLVAAGSEFPLARRFVLKYNLGGNEVLEYGPQAFNGPGVYPLGAVFRVPEGASDVQVWLGGNGARPGGLDDVGGALAWWDDVRVVEGAHEHLLPDSSVGFVIKT